MVEMIIAITIMVFMVTAVLSNTRDIGTQSKVKRAALLIVDNGKDVRSSSVSVNQYLPGIFPSYALHFDMANPSQFIVYVDCIADDDGNNIIDDRDTFDFDVSSTSCGGGNGLVRTVAMDPNVEIKSIEAVYPVNGVNATSTVSKISIQFLRPEPTVWIVDNNGTLLPVGKVYITVGDLGNRFTKRVTFYTTGQFFAE